MWQSQMDISSDGNTHRYVLSSSGVAISFGESLNLWQTSCDFRDFFNQLLQQSPFNGFRFETRAVTRSTYDQPFEFVLLKHDALDRKVDPVTFREHFRIGAEVVKFANLRGDATLVAPCPSGPDSAYGHLAAFVRSAPVAQTHQLWGVIAEAMQERISRKPVWLNTAGMGVAWLHVRLDDRPKYYGYAPYRTAK